MLSNICQRGYTQTVDALKKQLPSRNHVSFDLDECAPTNKLAITSVIAVYILGNQALREVQLPFDDVDSLFFPNFEMILKLISQG